MDKPAAALQPAVAILPVTALHLLARADSVARMHYAVVSRLVPMILIVREGTVPGIFVRSRLVVVRRRWLSPVFVSRAFVEILLQT